MKHFFSHDEGARNDPKLIKVLMKLGQEGKGVYWDLVEMLYEQDGCLMLSECDSYAFALRTKSELIESLIHDFFLFENDGLKFWSNSVLRRLRFRKEKSQKASESAAKRWENTNAMRTHSEGNAIKESKVKESKEKEKVKEGVALPPDLSDNFRAVWVELTAMPKWKNKPVSALQKAVNSLARYDQPFAVALMEKAIMGNYLGVIFDDTDEAYRKWKVAGPVKVAPVDNSATYEDLMKPEYKNEGRITPAFQFSSAVTS